VQRGLVPIDQVLRHALREGLFASARSVARTTYYYYF
jgi:hypothetical protein